MHLMVSKVLANHNTIAHAVQDFLPNTSSNLANSYLDPTLIISPTGLCTLTH